LSTMEQCLMLTELIMYPLNLCLQFTAKLFRSQPPFLSRMVLDIYEYTRDVEWLAKQVSALEKMWHFFMSEPHLVTYSIWLNLRNSDLRRFAIKQILRAWKWTLLWSCLCWKRSWGKEPLRKVNCTRS
jgi:hypothetical protein